ncbi:MAG: hypothetical protein K6G91_10365 [Kiritimatiellae bacterium]|nr:hypothetical protein [Kiritimatiellia bacterium]
MNIKPEKGRKAAASQTMSLLLLPLLVGVVNIVCYYFAALFASTDGAIPVPQPDTPLYYQAALRIVEGAPFSFSSGTAPSTGTTSVLYPFVLAIPYAMGFTGDALMSAGFWLNALFYLVFLFGWSVAIVNWISDSRASFLALILLSLSGHPIYTALSQSDMGFWMAVSALLLASISAGWFWTTAALLVISPWVRPEGMICGVAFFATVLCACKWNRQLVREIWLIVPFVASVCGVFALNYLLTGELQFSSVSHKGYLKQYDLCSAFVCTFNDAFNMFREVVLSLSVNIPRSLYSVPFVGGLLTVVGVFAHDWGRRSVWRQYACLGAFLLAFLSVAQSQWQGSNMDRYLAWMTPIISVYIAEGAVYLASKFPKNRFAAILPAMVVLYAVGASGVFVCLFKGFSSRSDSRRIFAKNGAMLIEPKASVASAGECGLVYFMGDRRVANISGVYSPEFEQVPLAATMEDLKHNQEKRFDYWLFDEDFPSVRSGEFGEAAFGACVLAGPKTLALHKMNWQAYDEGCRPSLPLSGEKLIARVDVGYSADEKVSNYEVIDRYSRKAAWPFFHCSKDVEGRIIADAGRIIAGGDAMDVRLIPGVDVRIVMRSVSTAAATISAGLFTETLHGQIPETFSMNIAVDGQIIEKVTLKCDQKWFSEAEFVIPGSAITKEVSRIAFLGDHIPCGYWFYQKM